MVYAWSVDSGEKVATLDGGHPGPTTSVQFNPRFMTLASACTNVVSPAAILLAFSYIYAIIVVTSNALVSLSLH